jgi:hypothetical protein
MNTFFKKQVQWLTPVILATGEAEIRKIEFRGQSRQKVIETPSQPVKAGHGGTPLSSSYSGGIQPRLMAQAGPGINARPYLKNNQTKKGLEMWFQWKGLASMKP